MTGGYGIRYSQARVRDLDEGGSGISGSNFETFLREHIDKRDVLWRRGMLDGEVIIETIPTVDPDLVADEG